MGQVVKLGDGPKAERPMGASKAAPAAKKASTAAPPEFLQNRPLMIGIAAVVALVLIVGAVFMIRGGSGAGSPATTEHFDPAGNSPHDR